MAKPVQALREQATALEAALAVCAAHPRKKAVHQLRTSTRRMEAQLELLDQLKGLPRYRKQAAEFRRVIQPIRKLAGKVRDLDVLSDHLRALHVPEHNHRPALLQSMQEQRTKQAAALQRKLQKHIPKIAKATDDLFLALHPAADLQLAIKDLLPLAHRSFQRNTRTLDLRNEDDLHTLRKAAKAARYMAETGLPAKQAAEAAHQYNHLQQSGGRWHDSLLLAQFAKKELGRNDAITQQTRTQAKVHLASFERLLRTA